MRVGPVVVFAVLKREDEIGGSGCRMRQGVIWLSVIGHGRPRPQRLPVVTEEVANRTTRAFDHFDGDMAASYRFSDMDMKLTTVRVTSRNSLELA